MRFCNRKTLKISFLENDGIFSHNSFQTFKDLQLIQEKLYVVLHF